jgi:hypothetical protein
MNKLSRADILNMFGYKAGTKLYNLLYSSCANFCCIIKNCLGISSGGNAGLVLNQQGNWVTAGGGSSQIEIQSAASDELTPLTSGVSKVTFRAPSAFTLTGVRASLTTAQGSGSIFTVDINQNGSSLLSTKLTIDNTEKTSVTAVTPAVISTSAIINDAEITVDIDQIGNGTATGLKITLIGTR